MSRPIVIYRSEARTLTVSKGTYLKRWERKMLRRIYGTRGDGDKWRIRTNEESERIFSEVYMVIEIKRNRISWAGGCWTIEL